LASGRGKGSARSAQSAVNRFDPTNAAALRWALPDSMRVERFDIGEFSSDQRRVLGELCHQYVWWFSQRDMEDNPGRVLCQAMDLDKDTMRDGLLAAFGADVLRRALVYGQGHGWLNSRSIAWWATRLGALATS
jgi:uncharacterized protein (DUF3820 family)